MLISFLGSLPPGIINIAAFQIAGKQGNGNAMIYGIGSMLAEVIVVRVALSGMSRITRSRKFFLILEWIAAALLVIFSIACFITADQMQQFPVIPPAWILPPFLTGLALSAINPLQIPFWLGWSTVLMNKGVLVPKPRQYNIYITGIASGTMAGFIVFIFGGQYLLKAFQSNQYLVNMAVGLTLSIVALLHIRKMILVPAAVRHSNLFRRLS